ncbi:MAG: hypothetical protein WCW47_03715 [Candidatus Paceibacterota bacterium]|jgi:hypothetical protein
MSNQSIIKYFIVIIIVLILLSLGFIYIFSVKISKETPYQTLTPENYEKGTVVNLYKNIPPGFPKEVVLENKTLDYSGSVTTSQDKTRITVSYISDKNMQNVVGIYEKSLPDVGWNIVDKSIYEQVSIIRAIKEEQSILVSISPLKEDETMVTFQYEK